MRIKAQAKRVVRCSLLFIVYTCGVYLTGQEYIGEHLMAGNVFALFVYGRLHGQIVELLVGRIVGQTERLIGVASFAYTRNS
jgi:hypothetical protein